MKLFALFRTCIAFALLALPMAVAVPAVSLAQEVLAPASAPDLAAYPVAYQIVLTLAMLSAAVIMVALFVLVLMSDRSRRVNDDDRLNFDPWTLPDRS
jgi:hypothetical protein